MEVLHIYGNPGSLYPSKYDYKNNIGIKIRGNEIKKMKVDDVENILADEHLAFNAKQNLKVIEYLKTTKKKGITH